MPQIIPIKDLKNTSEVSERCHSIDEPVFITKNGYGDMVIMSIEAYEKMAYMNDIYEKIQQGEKSIDNNRVMTAKQSVEELRSKYEI
ncbi:type II toxin-antitoxin system Phd/YefM family antitoxin [Ructibacterium gallinarum]|uniref:Antitoxin n=1 Tax=Ructibacterium gallinarum TaxID=2779355 RepID=A0A9D5M1V5_9FIRM|nr:type II toxin-antitoxin system Phd/YefM family antitoxin [Ructibacterium gallinarum]MBE5040770.1 type II toxin-antitoxin system Phd/YefM family antitoxin [Ructibacterium gallinarum]